MSESNEYQAGRALDALIAEKVFGYKVEGVAEPGYWVTEGSFKVDGYEKARWRDLPHYSTKETAAFEIVNHFTHQEKPYYFNLEYDASFRHWEAVFYRPSDDTPSNAVGKTPAETIARAALEVAA